MGVALRRRQAVNRVAVLLQRARGVGLAHHERGDVGAGRIPGEDRLRRLVLEGHVALAHPVRAEIFDQDPGRRRSELGGDPGGPQGVRRSHRGLRYDDVAVGVAREGRQDGKLALGTLPGVEREHLADHDERDRAGLLVPALLQCLQGFAAGRHPSHRHRQSFVLEEATGSGHPERIGAGEGWREDEDPTVLVSRPGGADPQDDGDDRAEPVRA